jgi:Lon protease-like protein
MDEEQELSGIQTLRLFPLPGVVLLPHAILPLHIFEPRYRQMMEDALESDGLITIIQARQKSVGAVGPAELEEYGCVGRVLKHARLPDGRFNLLLVGLKRARLVEELPSGKLYRTARAEILDDIEVADERGELRSKLIAEFKACLATSGGIDSDLDQIIMGEVPLGVLVDIMGHSIEMSILRKQLLLNEEDIATRAVLLLETLQELVQERRNRGSTSSTFPPPFSAN